MSALAAHFTSLFCMRWCWSRVLYLQSLWRIRSKSCRSDGKTCINTAGFGPGLVALFLWVRKGQMLCFFHLTIWWKTLLLIFTIYQTAECHPYHNITFLFWEQSFRRFVLPSMCFQSKHGNVSVSTRMSFLYQLLKYLCCFHVPTFELILF